MNADHETVTVKILTQPKDNDMADDNENQNVVSGLASQTGSRPRRRFKIEVVGYGDTYEEALDEIEMQLNDAYAEPITKTRIGDKGWVAVDEEPDARTGDEYTQACREYRKRKNSENSKMDNGE